MSKPIFADPTLRRSLWAKRIAGAVIAIVLIAALAFATTIVQVPDARSPVLPFIHARAAPWRPSARGEGGYAAWLPHARTPHSAAAATRPLAVGFYVNDDQTSLVSLKHNIDRLDWVVPTAARIGADGTSLVEAPDPLLDKVLAGAATHPKVLPMVQNLTADTWDGRGTLAVLRDPAKSRALAQAIAAMVERRHAPGAVLDFEDMPAGFGPDYVRFLGTLRAALPRPAEIAITIPAGDANWPLAALARASDHVIYMAYDEHWQGGTPGPIASQGWFVRQVDTARRAIGPAKLIVALGNYAYDWHKGGVDALTVEEAWLAAHDSAAPIGFDTASGNPGFAYQDAGGVHQVNMLDAATAWNQLAAMRGLGLQQVALWRLGSEDPGFWNALAASRAGTRPDLGALTGLLGSDVEGSGELLRIAAVPTSGRRTVTFDHAGMIRAEAYRALPTPYVVERAGAADPKALALTFDDGPDPAYTPKILSILEAAQVPATFFVVGENAIGHPGLLNRIIRDGSELGSHTYTHPNLALDSPSEERLELNATQRLVEAYTGRKMTLFRAPYFGDAEPTTVDELEPARVAQDAGYTIAGLHVDPGDWTTPGVDAVVQRTIAQVHAASAEKSRNVILLHDGGGDRAQTVAALPRIIATLQAEGYHFVTASQLIGVPPRQAMPSISGSDLAAVRVDVAVFMVIAGLLVLIGWMFTFAITLGIARAVGLSVLAWQQSRAKRPAPPDFTPTVSVIIPAYNEDRVIAASVARVLASDYPALQVIVADDGSTDHTSACVEEAFGDDPRVTLLTLVNGGKAAALNRALVHATGEVIIALDADTQFEAQTIRRLARWFADPAIGAVAGDARVGNRVNLVTRWQAIEYITAQNLERRALAGFDAMMVVPGAVGAWRRAALDEVGGYPENTLAEDQDLTIAIQRRGWRVTYDQEAAAWTEAPETFRALAKQRYRWAFGTLQCLWKHRAVLRTRKPAGLALVGMPQAWLFQILFAAISPIIDLALVIAIIGTTARVIQHGWAQTSGDVVTVALFWLAFSTVDVVCGWIAYRLDGRGVRYPWHLLLAQRLVYRQIMYWVVLRAIGSAIAGWSVGWGKLERSGRVEARNEPALAHAPHSPDAAQTYDAPHDPSDRRRAGRGLRRVWKRPKAA